MSLLSLSAIKVFSAQEISPTQARSIIYRFVEEVSKKEHFKNLSNVKVNPIPVIYYTPLEKEKNYLFTLEKENKYLGYFIVNSRMPPLIQEFSYDMPPHLQNLQILREIAKEEIGNIQNEEFWYLSISQYAIFFSNKDKKIYIDPRSNKTIEVNQSKKIKKTPVQRETLAQQKLDFKFKIIKNIPKYTYYHSSYATSLAILLDYWNKICCEGILKDENIIEKIPNYFLSPDPEKGCICEAPDTLKRYLYETPYEVEIVEIKENLWDEYTKSIDENKPLLVHIVDESKNRHMVIGIGYLITKFGNFFVCQDQLFKNKVNEAEGIYFYNFDGTYDSLTLYKIEMPVKWQKN